LKLAVTIEEVVGNSTKLIVVQISEKSELRRDIRHYTSTRLERLEKSDSGMFGEDMSPR
jgi:hypothetical protein